MIKIYPVVFLNITLLLERTGILEKESYLRTERPKWYILPRIRND